MTSLRSQKVTFELTMFILEVEMMVYLPLREFDLQDDFSAR
jgi:hypothetical protein